MKKTVCVLVLILGIVFGVFSQTSGPMDLVVLLDTSASMSNSYRETSDYLIGPFLKEFLRIGDTFHLISFSETPRVEISRRVEGVGDVETVIGRLLLMYPLDAQSDVAGALSFGERYSSSLPGTRHRKIVLITDGDAPNTQNLVDDVSARLGRQGADLQYIKVPVAGNGPSSGRPAQAARPSPSREAPARQPSTAAPSPAPAAQTSPAASTPPSTSAQVPPVPPSAQAAQGTQASPRAPSQPAAPPVSRPGAAQPGSASPAAQVPPTGQTPPANQVSPPSQISPAAQTPPGGQAVSPPVGTVTPPITQGPGSSQSSSPLSDPAAGTAAQSSPQPLVPSRPSPETTVPVTPSPPAQTTAPAQTVNRSAENGFFSSDGIPLPLIIALIILALLVLGLIILFAARNLHSSPNRVMAQASAPMDNSGRIEAQRQEQIRGVEMMGSYAEAQRNQRKPLPKDKAYDEPTTEDGPLMLNLFVEDQNTAIGRRNIHVVKPGYTFSVGGGRSDFLIFLVPVPANIATVQFDGRNCTFTPRRPEYFPDIGSQQVPNCIGKVIRVISDKHYELFLRIERYQDPLKALNRMLRSISVPGEVNQGL